MAEPPLASTTGEFWRCAKCATPNPSAGYVTVCLGCGRDRPASPIRLPRPTAVMVRPTRGQWLLAASWAYAAVAIAALGAIRWVGNAWWGVTLLLLMPRVLFLVPVALLAIASGMRRCPSHWLVQAATAAVVAWPLMGASLPIQRLWQEAPAGDRVRVVTYNLGSEPIAVPEFLSWLERNSVDLVCFQEAGPTEPTCRVLRERGWVLGSRGLLATRLPVVAERSEFPHEWRDGGLYTAHLESLRLRTRSGREFVAASVHLPTIREGLEALLKHGDSATLVRHTDWWRRELSRVLSALSEAGSAPLILAGDFNVPSDESTMASLRSRFRFAFEDSAPGYGYTRPTGLPWVRIDHILTSPHWFIASCRVGPDFGSDHLPLLAEVVLPEPSSIAGRRFRD